MNDHQFHELMRVARDEEAREKEWLDERWDRLSAGSLTAEEETELKRLAAESEDAERAWQAFEPIDAAARARILERVRASASASEETAASGVTLPGLSLWDRLAAFLGDPPEPRRWVAVGGVVAVAALVLWMVVPPEPLPAYRLSLSGAVQSERSEEIPTSEETPRVVAGNRLEILLSPERALEGRLAARIYAIRGDTPRRLEWVPDISEDGAVRWVGVVGEEVDLEPGDWQLLVTTGRPGRLPSPGEIQDLTRGETVVATDRWSAWRLALRVD